MKRLSGLILLGLVVIGFYSCELFDEDEAGLQSALVYITHYYTGRRGVNWDRVYVPSIHAYGEIYGDPYPDFKYIQVCNKQFDDPAHINNNPGSIYFTTYNRIWEDSIPEPKFDPINVKISTDIGQLSGSITVPDTILTLSVSRQDTVALGTPVTISWTGSNADFYYVYWEHSWVMEEGYGWYMYSRDTLIQGNSVTLSGSKFTLDGFIEAIEVYPENGPFPEPGSEANLEGDGFGYMYLENKSKISDVQIVFGEGIPAEWLGKRVASRTVINEFNPDPKAKIKTNLGL